MNILQKNDMLKTSQHGFRPNHSKVTAMMEIVNKCFHSIDIGQLNRVVFLDFKKAFDTVDHEILLHKFYLDGIKGSALNNIDSIANTLNEDLANISDCMKANKLSLNASKTEYMVVGSHKRLHQTQSDPPITLGDNQIKRVKVTKWLGLMIETLTWDDQVTLITKKVSKGLNVMRR